ncbi:MAG: hypothetical protein AAFX87_15280 [Bacteroidota bacterium]
MKNFVSKILAFVIPYIILNVVVFFLLSFFGGGAWAKNLAIAIMVSWVIVLIIYYIWAIYFYNVNMGWTDSDWETVEERKKRDPDGNHDEPMENPHGDQTLGLPPGTVRGTLALSLMVGALAMAIASMAMPETLKENEFFIDNFEFFKTAFLMMIAFYFGNKSLEYLQNRPKVIGPPGTGGGGTTQSSSFRSNTSSQPAPNPSTFSGTQAKQALAGDNLEEVASSTGVDDIDYMSDEFDDPDSIG